MNEKTLPSRHIILNSSPGGLRLSTLPLGHGDNIESLRVSGEETLCFFEITLWWDSDRVCMSAFVSEPSYQLLQTIQKVMVWSIACANMQLE